MSIAMEINPFEFFTDTQGDALDGGYIWIGQPNLDPRQYPVAAFYDSDLTIPAPMPLRTSNGYIVRNGSPTFLYISGNYSVLVQDKNRRQIYYVPDFFLTGTGDPGNTTSPIGGVAVFGRAVVAVDNIKDLLVQIQRTDLRFLVKGYYANTLFGGGPWAWNPTLSRTLHNGGSIISPTVPWDGTHATIAAFLAGTGDPTPSALGCFERIGNVDSVDGFGAAGGTSDDTANFLACANAGFAIRLVQPAYTVNFLTSTTVGRFEILSDRFAKLNVSGAITLSNKTFVGLDNVDYDFTLQPSTEANGIFLTACQDGAITRNRMQHPWKTALNIWDSTGIQIYRNRIFNTGRGLQTAGIVPIGCGVIVFGCSDILIDHNWMKDIWQIPVFVTGNTGHETFDVQVTNNLLRTNNDNGIRIQPDDAVHALCHDVLVQGNIVSGTSRADCIRVSGNNISTIGNKVSGALSTGIDAQYATGGIISGNIISDCNEGIALTSFEVFTDNVTITNNQISNITGGTAAITVSNDSGTGGSFGTIRISGNKITKKASVPGTTRGISVAMSTTTGSENIVIQDNDINGYSAFGITVANLNRVFILGNTIGGVITSSTAHIQVQACSVITIGSNNDRGNEAFLPTQSIRLAGANGVTSIIGNTMPAAAIGIANPGTNTLLYRNGNFFNGGVQTPYVFTGGPVASRTLDTSATTAQIVNVLYALLDDLGNDRYVRR